jgi:RNA polymerase sigma factor (sigma-70 family)
MNDIFNDIITYLFSEKKLLKYNGYSKLSTWLYTIIRGHLIEFVKLEVYGRKIKIKQNEKSNYVFQGEFKKLGYINHKEIIHECEGINKKEKEAEAYEENIYKLKLLLNRCSERQVAVLKLYYCKDMHYREIGKTLNISKTAVGNEMKWIKALIEEYKVMTVCELS